MLEVKEFKLKRIKDSKKIKECLDRVLGIDNIVIFLGTRSEKVRDRYKHKKPKVDSLNNLTLAKNEESHSLDVILKTPLIKRKWSECQNSKKQPPPRYYRRDM